MAFSIGLRVYQISVHKDKDPIPLLLTSDGTPTDAYKFFSEFVHENTDSNDREDLQRSWFFDKRSGIAVNHVYGYLKYGTFGFESDLVDRKTKQSNYKRKVEDLEEIPLYFHTWFPAKERFALFAFQSFQARSCVQMVVGKACEEFRRKNKGYNLKFKKLMPTDLNGSILAAAPVKQFTLVKKKIPTNKEDRYLLNFRPEETEYEVTFKAKRRRTLGTLGEMLNQSSEYGSQVLCYDGVQFDEAKAEVNVGNKRRTVGVMGYSNDAGVIEVSDSVVIGADGHPTFGSIKHETEQILKDFYSTLSEPKK